MRELVLNNWDVQAQLDFGMNLLRVSDKNETLLVRRPLSVGVLTGICEYLDGAHIAYTDVRTSQVDLMISEALIRNLPSTNVKIVIFDDFDSAPLNVQISLLENFPKDKVAICIASA